MHTPTWLKTFEFFLYRMEIPIQPFLSKTASKNRLKWAVTWQNQQSECVPSEDSDQPGHPPSLIRVFAVRMKKAWVLSYSLSAQWRLWSDWVDAKADLSLRWVHTLFVCFVLYWGCKTTLVHDVRKTILMFWHHFWRLGVMLTSIFRQTFWRQRLR